MINNRQSNAGVEIKEFLEYYLELDKNIFDYMTSNEILDFMYAKTGIRRNEKTFSYTKISNKLHWKQKAERTIDSFDSRNISIDVSINESDRLDRLEDSINMILKHMTR